MIATTMPQGDPVVDLVRRRTRAGWIDVLVLFVVSVVVSVATGNAHVGAWTTVDNGVAVDHHGVAFNLPTGPFLIWVGLAVMYYFVDELLTGQTLGKRLLGLKVIKVNGGPLDRSAVMLRTAGRIIDVLPAFYFIGWIVMRGPRRPPQRLGDRIAGTTVVPISHAG